jgi:AraC family transcriptional regulator of adaptative response/methylated-DNA-[protein]-cysteine methyltransferase
MGAAPTLLGHTNILKASWLDTQLGPMIAIADETALYLLEFVDRRGLEREIERLRLKTKSAIVPGTTEPIHLVENELKAYFEGKLKEFTTSLCLKGSPFQMRVWERLQEIPCGETRSYSDIAKIIGRPTAFRAVAQANGANQLAIIIPCHRVINNNGELGGYGGGLMRKRWLINHEKEGIK